MFFWVFSLCVFSLKRKSLKIYIFRKPKTCVFPCGGFSAGDYFRLFAFGCLVIFSTGTLHLLFMLGGHGSNRLQSRRGTPQLVYIGGIQMAVGQNQTGTFSGSILMANMGCSRGYRGFDQITREEKPEQFCPFWL